MNKIIRAHLSSLVPATSASGVSKLSADGVHQFDETINP